MRFYLSLLTLSLLAFTAAASPSFVLAEILVLPGTGDSQALLRGLGDLYAQQQSDIVIVPESIGSSGGIRQVQKGKAVFARVARPLSEKESAAGLRWKPFAYSPVVFATHRKSGQVSNLTSSQVNAIFTGKMTDWSQLGGTPGKIFVAEREVGDSSRTILERVFTPLKGPRQPIGEVLYSTPEMVRVLSRYPQTIGYLPLSSIKGTQIRQFSLDGVVPSRKSMADNSYPLWIPLAVVWKGDLKVSARRFVDFLFTPTAQQFIQNCGLIPAGP